MMNLEKAIPVKRLMVSVDDIFTGEEKYNTLLAKVRWFFETEDALRTVHLRLVRGKTTLETYRELSVWAGDIESELRRECDDK
jgi:hypothetical protein